MMSDEKLMNFCRDLSAAVKSGLALSDAFATLARSREHGRAIEGAARLTAGGAMLHEALAAQGGFPPVFLALLRAGEEGGKTDEFLDLYAGMLEVRVEFRRRIGRALIYPAFAVLLAAALLLLFAFKAVPMIMEPLESAGLAVASRPAWLDAAAAFLADHWPAALAGLAVLLLLARAVARSGPGRKAFSLACHTLPGLRYASEQARLYQLYTTMGLLMKAGLPLSALMDVLGQFSEDDPLTRRRLARAAELVSSGAGFAASVEPVMPSDDRRGLEMAEKTGRLGETLLRLGKAACEKHLHRLKVLVASFRIAVLLALAPICFLLIFMLLRPVLALLRGEGGAFGSRPAAGSSALPGWERRDGGWERAGEAGGGGAAAAEDETARFNREQGGKVADFIRTRSAAARESSAPAPRLKSSIGGGFGGPSGLPGPTRIKPTEIRSGASGQ
ncbi:MAG TPA: type II secretion system F family protein [Elusimicrobiales bacterium]|nr:type II secretion system F family protein [Elusimicrobiales bacterium]